MDIIEFLHNMIIIALIIMFAWTVLTMMIDPSVFEPPEPVNHTEQVIIKDIGHVGHIGNPDIQYYIITNNYTFEVDVQTYNGLHTGDNVTIREYGGLTDLVYNDHYFSDVV